MLSLLLGARHDDGSPMSDEELRDELVTVLGAGHETTATGAGLGDRAAAAHPRVLARLRESLAAGEDDYLDATVKETLRARPVIVDVARKLTAPATIGGYELPAGTFVMPAIAALHYREDLFPEPEEFRPERFLDGKADNYAWIPFGGGVRRCIGAAFAEYEMRIVLRAILERAELSAPDPKPEKVKVRNITLAPGRGTAWSALATRPLTLTSAAPRPPPTARRARRPPASPPRGARSARSARPGLDQAAGSASSSSTCAQLGLGLLDLLGQAARLARRLLRGARRAAPLAAGSPALRPAPRRRLLRPRVRRARAGRSAQPLGWLRSSPSSQTRVRVPTASSRARSWETRITAPSKAESASSSASRLSMSRWLVGSSRISTLAPEATRIASESRRCSPPEMSLELTSRRRRRRRGSRRAGRAPSGR